MTCRLPGVLIAQYAVSKSHWGRATVHVYMCVCVTFIPIGDLHYVVWDYHWIRTVNDITTHTHSYISRVLEKLVKVSYPMVLCLLLLFSRTSRSCFKLRTYLTGHAHFHRQFHVPVMTLRTHSSDPTRDSVYNTGVNVICWHSTIMRWRGYYMDV